MPKIPREYHGSGDTFSVRFDIYRKVETEDWNVGVMECWNAELGDCTAEALGAQSKEFLIKKYSDLSELTRQEVLD